MKKRCKGEKIVFLPGRVASKSLLFLVFSCSVLFSQIKLNNFGISDFIKTNSGNTNFQFIDFDNDGIRDLFLYGKHEKSFVIHKGLKDSTFTGPIKKFFFYPIDDFKWFTKSVKGDDYYIFVSRNNRLAGLVSFTSTYSLRLLNTIEFNSYPSSIKITDFNKDGKNEALLFGNNFNGISYITNDGFRLKAESLNDQNVFSDIALLDFNQDDIDDLVVVDVLNNAVKFLEYTDILSFTEVREIPFNESIYSIRKFDYNGDNIEDLAIAEENFLDIFIGDSVYSYSTSIKLKFPFTPEKFLFTDFNNDQNKDLVVIDNNEDEINFFSDMDSIRSPIKIKVGGINALKKFEYNNHSYIAALSKMGKIQLISNEIRWGKTFSLSIGGTPNHIKFIDLKDTLGSYFLTSNSKNNAINVINIDSTGSFIDYKSRQFLNTFDEFNITHNLTQLITYSNHNRLLEIITKAKLEENFRNPNYFYTAYPVERLFFNDNNDIEVLESENEKLYLEQIVNVDGRYLSDTTSVIDTSVISSNKSVNNKVYFWKKNNEQYSFNNFFEGQKKRIIKIDDKNINDANTVIISDQSNESEELLTIFSESDFERIYIVNGARAELFENKINKLIPNQSDQQIIKYYSSALINKSLFVYRHSKNKIYIYEFDNQNKSLVLFNTIEAINLNDYFVHKFFDKTYLVYTNKDNNCITFKVLN